MADLSKVTTERFNIKNQTHKNAVSWLQERLRNTDRKETYLTTGTLSQAALDETFENYIVWDEDHRPLCIFGVCKNENVGYGHIVWLLGRYDLPRYRRNIVRFGQQKIREFAKKYGKLWNMILQENEQSVRWLKKAGATFSKPFEYNKHQWMLFTIESEVTGNVYDSGHVCHNGTTRDTAV